MSRHSYQTWYSRSQPYAVSGSLLNAYARSFNALCDHAYGGDERDGLLSVLGQQAIIGIAQITDASDTCAQQTGEQIAPCSSRGLFVGRRFVWHHDSEMWVQYQDDEDIDTAAGRGLRQTLWKGEIATIAFDLQRDRYVPLLLPQGYVATLLGELAASDGTTATSVSATLKKRTVDTNAIATALDADGDAMTATVYNFFNEGFSTGDVVLVERDSFGDLWVSCPVCEKSSSSFALCRCIAQPTSWNITISGIADNDCPNCDENYNGTFNLIFQGGCMWRYTASAACYVAPYADLLELTLSSIAGGFRVTVIWYIICSLGLQETVTWQRDFLGRDCMLSAENIPFLSAVNLCAPSACLGDPGGVPATCTVTAVP